jgi:hypothetical protein
MEDCDHCAGKGELKDPNAPITVVKAVSGPWGKPAEPKQVIWDIDDPEPPSNTGWGAPPKVEEEPNPWPNLKS